MSKRVGYSFKLDDKREVDRLKVLEDNDHRKRNMGVWKVSSMILGYLNMREFGVVLRRICEGF